MPYYRAEIDDYKCTCLVIEVDDKKIAANKPRNIAIELLNVFEPQNPPCDTE